jgi:hypothetical protein
MQMALFRRPKSALVEHVPSTGALRIGRRVGYPFRALCETAVVIETPVRILPFISLVPQTETGVEFLMPHHLQRFH